MLTSRGPRTALVNRCYWRAFSEAFRIRQFILVEPTILLTGSSPSFNCYHSQYVDLLGAEMNFIRAGLCALAMAVAVVPLSTAQAASQTIEISGTFNGKHYSSVTFTVTNNAYLITFHYDDGDQWTESISNGAAFYSMWQHARELSGSGVGND